MSQKVVKRLLAEAADIAERDPLEFYRLIDAEIELTDGEREAIKGCLAAIALSRSGPVLETETQAMNVTIHSVAS
jgi:hypothetical protein